MSVITYIAYGYLVAGVLATLRAVAHGRRNIRALGGIDRVPYEIRGRWTALPPWDPWFLCAFALTVTCWPALAIDRVVDRLR